MRNLIVRRGAVPAAALAALTGMAACSASPRDEAPGAGPARVGPVVAALRAAERSTRAAGSARVESTTTMGSLMSMTADGALGWDQGLSGTLTVRYTDGTVADTMRRLGTTSTQARYLPGAYYTRVGDAFAERTGGRHWIRYAYDDLERLGGGSGALLADQMRGSAPERPVRLLLASGDVRKVGEETVRGRRATHYAGTVDVADLAPGGSGSSGSGPAELKRQLEQAGVSTETVDIWVDDRDLLVKKTEKARTANGDLTQTAHYGDYGVRVAAHEPPADDTADFTELLSKRGGPGLAS